MAIWRVPSKFFVVRLDSVHYVAVVDIVGPQGYHIPTQFAVKPVKRRLHTALTPLFNTVRWAGLAHLALKDCLCDVP